VKQEETTPQPSNEPKSDYPQDKDRRNQNYHRDASQPVLASSPAVNDQVLNQARPNRRTA